MIKRTLYFGNPAYLSMRLKQLVIKTPEASDCPMDLNDAGMAVAVRTIPIEDIGIIILDNKQITVTQGLMEELLDSNCAVITCGSNHLPVGLMLPLYGHTLQNERFRYQLDASLPLKKQLWQQTIQYKISNQARMLRYVTGDEHGNMKAWASTVKSGDSDNLEARAAAYYWKTIFPDNENFIRGRDEDAPNNLLNYGYAVLRAVIARALVASGLLPTLGIHHHNRYNAYCLADDIMEPYRPFVDKLVFDIVQSGTNIELTKEIKTRLLSIPTIEVNMNGKRSPLIVAVSTTSSSLAKCFSGELRKLAYPEMT